MQKFFGLQQQQQQWVVPGKLLQLSAKKVRRELQLMHVNSTMSISSTINATP